MLTKLKNTVLEQLKQGATPEKLSQTIAFGVVLGLIPILGISTWLCLLFAFIFKLNHIVIQITHNVIYPLQLILVIPYCRAGEWLFQADPIKLNIKDVYQQFETNVWATLQKYAMTGLMGVVIWFITLPVIFYVTYWLSLKAMRKTSFFKAS